MSANTQRPRRVECVGAGWVRDSGHRRATASGCEGIVWEITPLGADALHQSSTEQE